MTETGTDVNTDITLRASGYLAEGHQRGNSKPYLDMLTEDYTFYAPVGEFRGKNVGKEKAKAFYDTMTAAN